MSKTAAITDPASATTPERFEIEVFRPGTFTPMGGKPMAFSAEQLTQIADGYDAANHPAPVVVGHPSIDAPAFGWIEGLRYDGERERLMATVGDVEPSFAEAVRAKRYRKVSISFHKPDGAANPVPGSTYPRHLGFLGGAAPAVSGLKPVEFGDAAEALTFPAAAVDDRHADFNDPGFQDVSSIFRSLREWMIDKFGMESADQVLPSYQIDWVDRGGQTPPEPVSNGFAAPTHSGDASVSKTTGQTSPADFAAREADLTAREKALAEGEAKRLHAEHDAFADELVEKGQLLPASKDQAVALLDKLADGWTEDLSFADGKSGATTTVGARETLKALLSAAPEIITYGRVDQGQPPASASAASFAAPDNFSADPAGLEIHTKAVAYQRDHPDVDWITACKAVS